MRLRDFHYELPEELVALYPVEKRSQSRLMCVDVSTGVTSHRTFCDVLDFLEAGDLLIFNDTRVIPARLFGRKQSGGAVELLIERLQDDNKVICQIRSSKSPKVQSGILFDRNSRNEPIPSIEVEVIGREKDMFYLQFPVELDMQTMLSEIGHIPLPPYIKREDKDMDEERYQTVYARNRGAVAAPTAGLHFDVELMSAIADRGIEQAFLTLHVGAGTFQPVREDNILEHRMHGEFIDVNKEVCDRVNACKSRGGRVVAVGTTSVRSLESTVVEGKLVPYRGETDIFIFPGFNFQIVDAMITNFHLPESTLLMLVSAFANKEMLLGAYQEAIAHRYRFFSYGDAMFLYR